MTDQDRRRRRHWLQQAAISRYYAEAIRNLVTAVIAAVIAGALVGAYLSPSDDAPTPPLSTLWDLFAALGVHRLAVSIFVVSSAVAIISAGAGLTALAVVQIEAAEAEAGDTSRAAVRRARWWTLAVGLLAAGGVVWFLHSLWKLISGLSQLPTV